MPPKIMTAEQREKEKELILKASLELVEESGYRNITVRKIALKCNRAHGTIYNYFDNKDEILLSLVDKGFNILKQHLHAINREELSKKQNFVNMLTVIYNFGINEPNYFNLMFGIEVPKCSDFILIEGIEGKAISQKENAIEFYNLYTRTCLDYCSKMSEENILNVFIQVAGIVWLENARILKEINFDKKRIFNSTMCEIVDKYDNL